MDTKAEKGILIGYEGDGGYRIFVQPGNVSRTYRSRDVIFDEKVLTQTVSNFPVNINSDADDHKSILEQESVKHVAVSNN